MSSRTPRVMMPSAAAGTAAHAEPVAATASESARPLYIVPSQKMWHGESTWVMVLPWNMMPSRSFEKPQLRSLRNPGTGMFSAPGMSAAHGQVVVDRSISSGTVISHAHDTLLPWRTARAAASRTSSVMWFRVPSSSSSPHRPQFDSVLKYRSTSSCVGIGRPAVIPASAPPVTRFEAPHAGYPPLDRRAHWLVDQTIRPHLPPPPAPSKSRTATTITAADSLPGDIHTTVAPITQCAH